MHIHILKENLSKILSIVGRSISTRPQLPILSNILIEADDNTVSVAGTNLEIGIMGTVRAKIETKGAVAVPGKLFIEYISSLLGDKIEILAEKTSVSIKTKTSQATFTTVNPSDFPPFPTTSTTTLTLPLEKIKDAVLRTIFSASSDETRPVLTGVRTLITAGKISFAATDGYRLSLEEVEVAGAREDTSMILPAQSLGEVIRIAQEVKAKEIGFTLIENKNQVIFSLPEVHIFTRLIDGEFPNVEKIIPQNFKTRVTVEKDAFAQGVKVASLFARGAANIIRVKVEKEGLKLFANTPQIGENENFVEANVQGEETEIAFNYRFLLDVLSHFPDKDVVFESSGPLNPGIIKPTSENSTFLHIIMPVRVQGS